MTAGKRQTSPFGVATKNPLVRQDRYSVGALDLKARIGDEIFRVVDYSAFGIAIAFPRQEKIPTEDCRATLIHGSVPLGERRLRLVRQDPADGTVRAAFETLDGSLPMQQIGALQNVAELIAERDRENSTTAEIPTEFRRQVAELKSDLSGLEVALNGIGLNELDHSRAEIEQYEGTVARAMTGHFGDLLRSHLSAMAETLANRDRRATDACFSYFRRALADLIFQSTFTDRSFTKPRGYAGDFEMMNIIYRKEEIGETLFAKCLHRYFIDIPASRAVRNRARYLAAKLHATASKRRCCKVLSVASGPAREIYELLRSHPESLEQIELHLLDQDEEALKNAQLSIRRAAHEVGISPTIKLHNMAIKNLVANGLGVERYDLIYCAGLFDYLSDGLALRAARRMYELLESDADLVVGNFDIENPDRFAMNIIADWNLVHRSEDDMTRLFGEIGDAHRVETEEESVNLFSVISRRELRTPRHRRPNAGPCENSPESRRVESFAGQRVS